MVAIFVTVFFLIFVGVVLILLQLIKMEDKIDELKALLNDHDYRDHLKSEGLQVEHLLSHKLGQVYGDVRVPEGTEPTRATWVN